MSERIEPYRGKVGPANAMSAFEPAFNVAYQKAAGAIMEAVLEFERSTGRIVNELDLGNIDVTTIAGPRSHIRQVDLRFLPTPGEVAW